MPISSDSPNKMGDLTGPTQHCLQLLRDISSNSTMNERARKETFVSYLRLIFPEPEHGSLITSLAGGAETYLKTLPSSLSPSTRGFADTLNGRLVVEFKANLRDKSARDTAETELKTYIASLWTSSGPEASFCCIATDVLQWIVWRPVPNMTPSSGRYTADMVVLEAIDTFEITIPPNESNAQHLVLLLKRTIIDANLLPLDAENLRRDFGLDGALYALSLPIMRNIISGFRKAPEVDLALDLWEHYQAFNAHSTRGFDIDFYSKQLYLVILSRMMVAAYFEDRTDTTVDDVKIRSILTGDFFSSRMRLANLVERDFFGWTTSDPWIEQFLPITRQIYHSLRSYDFSISTKENIFRLIYDEMMPTEQQELLGQRSTPEPLATSIIRRLLKGHKHGYRYLDPACGSGSFMQAVLQENISQFANKGLSFQEQLSLLINAATGIDIDPIAVILAKAAWTLTVAHLLPYSSELVNIPIYHADSLFVVNDQLALERGKKKKTSSDKPSIVFDNATIDVPIELFNDIPAFDKFVNWCYNRAQVLSDASRDSDDPIDYIKTAKINIKLSVILGNAYSLELGEQSKDLTTSIEQLVRELAQRIWDQRNGIWAFILRNSYRPSLFTGRFDLIASNPPWLAMSSLPNIPYQAQLLQKAKYFNIRPTGASFLHTEIASTFALHNVYHFLADGGSAAFIMPRTLFNGDHHHQFRLRLYADVVPFIIKEIWDLDKVDNLFKVPSCVVFGTKTSGVIQDATTPIPTLLWNDLNADASTIPTGSIKLSHFGQKTAWMENNPLNSEVRSYEYYTDMFRQGADLMPRTALFVELIKDNPSQDIVAVRSSSIEMENPNNKVLKGQRFQGSVNRRYLFSTITSNVLLPFVVLEEQGPTILLPIEFDEGEIRILSNEELVDRGDIETARWFAEIDRQLGENTIRNRIDKRKKLTQQYYQNAQFLVHYGTGGSLPCAGIQHLDRSFARPFIADQTTYVCTVDNEDEAFFLIGVLNAPILAKIIKPFQAKGDFGARHIHKLPLGIVPPFRPEDSSHKHIVTLSREAFTAAQEAISDEMRNEQIPVARRRPLLRISINKELEAINKAVREVL